MSNNEFPTVPPSEPPAAEAPNLPSPPPVVPKRQSESGALTLMRWSIIICIYIGIIGAGGIYGVTAFKFFAKVFALPDSGGSSLMLISFLAGVPLAIGALCAFLASLTKQALKNGEPQPPFALSANIIAGISGAFFAFAGGAIMQEGAICVAMALPLFVGMAVLGAIIIGIASLFGAKTKNKVLGLMLLCPFAAAPIEQNMVPENAYQQVSRSVFIAAAPAQIWQIIHQPQDIKPAEFKAGLVYKIGVPYPLSARTIEARVGGTRESYWERGVKFDEIITAWDENRHIAWVYKFDQNSFPAGALDDHIVIGGRYFNLENTAYTLTPEAGGTRLHIAIKSRVSTTFNWYAANFAQFLIDDTADALLAFYKNRAELR